jgi:hypothetical protein
LSAAGFVACADATAGRFVRAHLEPGRLHYFDTSRVHTLVNAGSGERLTLSFDLFANDWVRERFPAVREEVGDDPLPPLPRPGPMRSLVARAAALLHPLRTRAQGLRRGRVS